KQGILRVYLKYTADERSVLTGLKRVSKPGRRVYVRKTDIPRVLGGLGTTILSTSQGLMSDKEARAAGLGGELPGPVLERGAISRVGKKITDLPQGVSVESQGKKVTVKGPKGSLSMELLPGFGLQQEGTQVAVLLKEGNLKTHNALHGTTRANLANMVTGVS